MVALDYAVDVLGWKITRYQVIDGKIEYLTGNGWKRKKPYEPVEHDYATIWEENDAEDLFLALLNEVVKGNLKVDIKKKYSKVNFNA